MYLEWIRIQEALLLEFLSIHHTFTPLHPGSTYSSFLLQSYLEHLPFRFNTRHLCGPGLYHRRTINNSLSRQSHSFCFVRFCEPFCYLEPSQLCQLILFCSDVKLHIFKNVSNMRHWILRPPCVVTYSLWTCTKFLFFTDMGCICSVEWICVPICIFLNFFYLQLWNIHGHSNRY